MKIAYILPSLDAKGPIMVVKSLSDYLISKGHELTVYYFDDKRKVDFDCKTEKISMDDKIDFDYFDIIHSHCMRPDIYLSKNRKNIKHAKIVSTLHQDTYQSFKYEYNPVFSLVFTGYWCYVQSNFDIVVSISNQLKDIYKRWIKTEFITIYNGCAISIDNCYRSEHTQILASKKEEGYSIIGTYAYVTKRKGLDQVIKAMPSLPNCIFVIIGNGPEIDVLKSMAEKSGVADRVVFIPHQDNPCNLLPYIDVYVMPSYSEGFGLAMVEAAFARKAIVCSDLPSFREIFPNDEALFFELKKISSLKNRIDESLERKEVLGNMAYNRVCRNFKSDIMAEHYESLYTKLINKQS